MATLQDLFNELQADDRIAAPDTFEDFQSKMENPDYAAKVDDVLSRNGYDTSAYEGLKKKEASMDESVAPSQQELQQPSEVIEPIQTVGTEPTEEVVSEQPVGEEVVVEEPVVESAIEPTAETTAEVPAEVQQTNAIEKPVFSAPAPINTTSLFKKKKPEETKEELAAKKLPFDETYNVSMGYYNQNTNKVEVIVEPKEEGAYPYTQIVDADDPWIESVKKSFPGMTIYGDEKEWKTASAQKMAKEENVVPSTTLGGLPISPIEISANKPGRLGKVLQKIYGWDDARLEQFYKERQEKKANRTPLEVWSDEFGNYLTGSKDYAEIKQAKELVKAENLNNATVLKQNYDPVFSNGRVSNYDENAILEEYATDPQAAYSKYKNFRSDVTLDYYDAEERYLNTQGKDTDQIRYERSKYEALINDERNGEDLDRVDEEFIQAQEARSINVYANSKGADVTILTSTKEYEKASKDLRNTNFKILQAQKRLQELGYDAAGKTINEQGKMLTKQQIEAKKSADEMTSLNDDYDKFTAPLVSRQETINQEIQKLEAKGNLSREEQADYSNLVEESNGINEQINSKTAVYTEAWTKAQENYNKYYTEATSSYQTIKEQEKKISDPEVQSLVKIINNATDEKNFIINQTGVDATAISDLTTAASKVELFNKLNERSQAHEQSSVNRFDDIKQREELNAKVDLFEKTMDDMIGVPIVRNIRSFQKGVANTIFKMGTGVLFSPAYLFNLFVADDEYSTMDRFTETLSDASTVLDPFTTVRSDADMVDKIMHATGGAAVQMFAMATGSGTLMELGLGANTSQAIVTFMSSFPLNYQDNINAGMNPMDARNISLLNTATDVLLEGIYGDAKIYKALKASRTSLIKEGIKAGKSVDEIMVDFYKSLPKEVADKAKSVGVRMVAMAEGGGLNALEEVTQMGSQKITNQAYNYVNDGSIAEVGTSGEEFILTSLPALFLGTAGNATIDISDTKSRDALSEGILYVGANSKDFLSEIEKQAPEYFEQNKKSLEEISMVAKESQKLPGYATLDANLKAHVLSETIRKKNLETAMKKFGLEDPKTKEEIANIDTEIQQILAGEKTSNINETPQEDAIQEPSTGEVLQREPQEVGETGGQRQGMEPVLEGQGTAQEVGKEEVVPTVETQKKQEELKSVTDKIKQIETENYDENKGVVFNKKTFKEYNDLVAKQAQLKEEIATPQEVTQEVAKEEIIATPKEQKEQEAMQTDVDQVQQSTGTVINLNQDGTLTINAPEKGGQSKKEAAIENAKQQLSRLGYNVESRVTQPTQQEAAQYEVVQEQVQPEITDEEFGNSIKEAEGLGVVAGTQSMNDLQNRTAQDPKKGKIVSQASRAVKALQSLFPNMNIVLHENDESYNNAMNTLGGSVNTRGQFVYKPSAEGDIQGAVHINLDRANTRTIAHEVTHAALLKMFKGDGKVFNNFKEKLKDVAKNKKITITDKSGNQIETTWGEEAEKLSSRYQTEDQAEEYLAELGGLVAEMDVTNPANKSILQKIAEFINNFILSSPQLKALGVKPISDTSSAEEVLEFFDTLGKKISRGEEIQDFEDVNSMGLSGVINVADGVKTKSSIDSGEIKRFPVHPNTKVKEDVPLKEFNGKVTNLMESDRMTGGYISDVEGNALFKFFGGVYYPVITNKWWASGKKSTAKGIAENGNKNRDKDGYTYATPMVGSDKQHMSNTDMLTITIELMKFDANSKTSKVKKSDVISYIDKAFSKKKVKGKKGILKAVFKKSNTINDLFNELEFVLFQEGDKILDRNGNPILDENKKTISKFTFEERLEVVNSVLGDPKVKEARFPSAGSISEAAKRFEEPITAKANYIGDIVTVMRTKGNLKSRATKINDEFYHKSYPFEIYAENEDGSPAEIEVYILDGAYPLKDVVPSYKNTKGKELTFNEVLKKWLAVGHTEKKAIGQYARTAKLAYATGEIKTGVKTKAQLDEDIDGVFKDSPELESIGTTKEYAEYLDEVFPDRKLKDIFYRGTPDPNMIEAEDIDPKKGTGAKNLGIGIYWTLDKKKSANYTGGGKGRVMAAILDIKNFHVVDINTNARRGYANPKDLTVSEATNGADAAISYDGLDKKNYVDFKTDGTNTTYIGEYIGPVDENGLPTYQKDNEITPKMTELAVESNEQVHILGGKKDQEGFKNFVEGKKTGVKTKSQLDEVVVTKSESKNPSFEDMLDFNVDGGVLEIGKVKGSKVYSILKLSVNEDKRRQGLATKLLKSALDKTNGELSGMASNDASVELNYKLGMRAYENGQELSLEQSKDLREKKSGESIKMILPQEERGDNYKPKLTEEKGVVAKSQMDDVQRTAQMYNMSEQGFFPKNADEFKINRDFQKFGLKAKRASSSGYGPGSLYLVNQAGRKINPFNRPKGKSQLSDGETDIAEQIAGNAKSIMDTTGVSKAEAINQAVLEVTYGNQEAADNYLKQPGVKEIIDNKIKQIKAKTERELEADSDKITISERKLLTDRIKAEVKAALEGRKEGKKEGIEQAEEKAQKTIDALNKKLEEGKITKQELQDRVKELGYNIRFEAGVARLAGEKAGKTMGKKFGEFVGYFKGLKAGRTEQRGLGALVSDYIKDVVDNEFGKKGLISPATLKAISRRAATISNQKQLDAFVSYLDNVIANNRLAEGINEIQKLQKKLLDKVGYQYTAQIKQFAKFDLFTPDGEFAFDMDTMEKYLEALQDLNQKVPNIGKMMELFDEMYETDQNNLPEDVDIEKEMKSLEKAAEKLFEDTEINDFEDYRKFKREVNKYIRAANTLYESGQISELDHQSFLNEVINQEAQYDTYATEFQDQIDALKTNIANEIVDKGTNSLWDSIKDWLNNSPNNFTRNQKKLMEQLQRAKFDNLMTLSLDDLDLLNQVVTQIAENGFVDEKNLRSILDRAEIRGEKVGEKLNSQADKMSSKYKGPNTFMKMSLNLLNKGVVFWETTLGMKENGAFRKNVIDPITNAFNAWTEDTQRILKEYRNSVVKLKLRGNYKIKTTRLQKDELVPTGKTRKVSKEAYRRVKIGVIGHILDNAWNAKQKKKNVNDWLGSQLMDHSTRNAMADESVDELDIVQDVYNDLLEQFPDGKGGLDHMAVLAAFEDPKTQKSVMKEDELEYYNAARTSLQEAGEYINSANAIRNKQHELNPYYMPRQSVGVGMGSVTSNDISYNQKLGTAIRSSASYARTLQVPKEAIRFNVDRLVATNVNEGLRDYHLTEAKRYVNEVFSNARESASNEEADVLKNLQRLNNTRIPYALNKTNPVMIATPLLNVFYTNSLIGIYRTPVEFLNNVISYSLGNRSLKSITMPFTSREKEQTNKLLSEFQSSVQFEEPERQTRFINKKWYQSSKGVNGLISTQKGNQLLIPLLNNVTAFMRKGEWKTQFDRAFENTTGEKFNYEKHFVKEKATYFEDMEQAASDADFNVRRIIKGGNKSEQRQFVQWVPFNRKGRVAADSFAASFLGMFSGFIGHDVDNMLSGLKKTVKPGEIKDGVMQFLGAAGRLSLYPTLMLVAKALGKMYFGDDDEKEEGKETLDTLKTAEGWADLSMYTFKQLIATTAMGKYAFGGKVVGNFFLHAAYSMTEDRKQRRFIEDTMREMYFTDPIDLKYFNKDDWELQMIANLEPITKMLGETLNDISKDISNKGKERITLYDLYEWTEQTEEGKQWMSLASAVLTLGQVTSIALTGTAIPFVDDIVKLGEDYLNQKEPNKNTIYKTPSGKEIDMLELVLNDDGKIDINVPGITQRDRDRYSELATEKFNASLPEAYAISFPQDQYEYLKYLRDKAKYDAGKELGYPYEGWSTTENEMVSTEPIPWYDQDNAPEDEVLLDNLHKDIIKGKQLSFTQNIKEKRKVEDYMFKELDKNPTLKQDYENAPDGGKLGIREYFKAKYLYDKYELTNPPLESNYFNKEDGKIKQVEMTPEEEN